MNRSVHHDTMVDCSIRLHGTEAAILPRSSEMQKFNFSLSSTPFQVHDAEETSRTNRKRNKYFKRQYSNMIQNEYHD